MRVNVEIGVDRVRKFLNYGGTYVLGKTNGFGRELKKTYQYKRSYKGPVVKGVFECRFTTFS